ncbi:MAG: hypothetical protein PHY45_02185 [Rhodocyclaceae bacterium]|nr:hypothetical protein [Rhodocyclaceae bacterium]
MKTRRLFLLAILASAICGGNAAAQKPAATVHQSARGFVRTAAIATALHDEPAGRPAYAPPCTRSTFTELGHGHGDVAGAGYATVYCPSYGQTADAGSSNQF